MLTSSDPQPESQAVTRTRILMRAAPQPLRAIRTRTLLAAPSVTRQAESQLGKREALERLIETSTGKMMLDAACEGDEDSEESEPNVESDGQPDLLDLALTELATALHRKLVLTGSRRMKKVVDFMGEFQGKIDDILEVTPLSFPELNSVSKQSLSNIFTGSACSLPRRRSRKTLCAIRRRWTRS